MKKCFTKVVSVALCIALLLICLPNHLAFADEIMQDGEMPINSEITEDENEQLEANALFETEEISPTEEVVIEETVAEALVITEEVTTKELITAEEITTEEVSIEEKEEVITEELVITEEITITEEILDTTEEEIELQTIEGDTIYEINSQEDWDNLVHGVTDDVNWQDGIYVGEDDVSITLNCNIVSDIEIVKFTNDVAWNINLNGNIFSSTYNTFGIKFTDNISPSGSVNIYGGTINKIGLDCSKGPSNVSISGIMFTDCATTAIDAGYCRGKVYVSDCTISHTKEDNADTGIYCSYLNGNTTDISVSDVSISGFYNGIMGGYSSCPKSLKSVTITDVHVGIDLLYGSSGKTVINNCIITGDEKSNSVGIKAGFSDGSSSSRWFLENEKSNSYIEGCQIAGFETGVKCEASYYMAVYDSTISNVINGILSSPTFIFVKDSTIMANESVNTYEGNSYGVANTSGNGYLVLNSEIAGFKIGSYNSGGSGHIVGSVYDNLDINADVYMSSIYGCSFKNAKIGIQLHGGTVSVANSEIVGNNSEGSIGMYNLSGSTCTVIGTDKGVEIPYGGTDGIINYVNTNMPDCHYNMVIKNYETGAKNPGNPFNPVGLEIKDCTTGIEMSSGQIYTGINGQKSSIDNPVEVYDCINGIILSSYSACYTNGSDIVVHDCLETGFQSTVQVSGNGNTEDSYGYEVYNCRNGFNLSGNSANTLFIAHDNQEKGVIIRSDGRSVSAYVALQSYNNGDYNIYLEGDVSGNLLSGIDTKTVGSEIGNMYMDGNSSGYNVVRFNGKKWISDDGEIYLTDGKKLYLNPSSGSTDWLEGTMLFDVPDYSDGREVAQVPVSNVYNAPDDFKGIPDYTLWSDAWIRTHMFAEKEGWIIKWVPEDVSNPGLGNLVLHEGCEVTYDYTTNGGTELVTEYAMNDRNVIAYSDGSEIDLTLQGVKEGYEFVGWNTDKNATNGLNALTAGTTDITLYAIYKKTLTVTYHDYSNNTFTQTATLYNNMQGISINLAKYAGGTDYLFVGYVDDIDAEPESEDDVMSEGDTYVVYGDTDIYTVYKNSASILYLDKDGKTVIKTDTSTLMGVVDKITSLIFRFMTITAPGHAGYKFLGWSGYGDDIYNEHIGLAIGASNITLRAQYSEIKVEGVEVLPKEAAIYVEERIQLGVTVTPADALDKSVTWSSEDELIATVDENGMVTGISEGVVKVYATSNDGTNISGFATITVKDASTGSPFITVSDDYKVSITPGEVVNDELDKLWYRVNGGNWIEYVEPFPVYKKFKVEAYQTTKIKKVESAIIEVEGVEYADGITAEYIGNDKPIGEDVINPEVKVTVHYPNSPDETVTDFTLVDFTIKIVGSNIVIVEYNEYPDDENSPTLKSQVTVKGYEESNEPSIITGDVPHNEPKTGDNTMPIIPLVLGVISLLCIIGVLKKKHNCM